MMRNFFIIKTNQYGLENMDIILIQVVGGPFLIIQLLWAMLQMTEELM